MSDDVRTFVLPPNDRAQALIRVVEYLTTCLPDKQVEVRITRYRRKRSDEQNRYLWGVVYPSIIDAGGESLRGWTNEDLHELFLGRHFGWEMLEGFGSKRKRPVRRSSGLTTIEFQDFVASIQLFCAEQGIYIPDPNEVVA